jgi:hypothetical protein
MYLPADFDRILICNNVQVKRAAYRRQIELRRVRRLVLAAGSHNRAIQ